MKLWTIAIKDTLVRFRDRNALIMMLVAPLLISLVMGLAFGGSGGGVRISEIPVVVVNEDQGEFGAEVVAVLAGLMADGAEDGRFLFTITEMQDKQTALREVEQGNARGVIYIPQNFSQRLTAPDGPPVVLEVYTDPTANVSPGIIRGVVNRIVAEFNTVALSNVVAVIQLTRLLAQADEPPSAAVLANMANLEQILAEESQALDGPQGENGRIVLATELQGEAETINLLNYFVPSMAIFFLMFTMFDGTRSILKEEQDGTLYRLMTTPTSRAAVLLGKIGGTFLTGLLQFLVLVAVSWLFFQVDWGNSPVGVLLLALATVAAATSLGAFVAAFARDVNQAGVLGTAVTLVFAILGGNFIDYRQFPGFLAIFSKMTINRWSLEGFVELTLGHASLYEVMPNVAVLIGLATLFFVLSLVLFERRFVR